MMKKTLKPKLRAIKPILRQILFLKRLEAECERAYDLITSRMVEDLLTHVKTMEPLLKSDDERPDVGYEGWSKDVPRMRIDLSSVSSTIDKYMDALRYVLLGKAAGKNAEEAVLLLRLKTKIPDGGVIQGFLSGLDAQTEYFKGILGTSQEPSKKWTTLALDFIKEKTGLMVDSKTLELKSRALSALQETIKGLDVQNEAAVREYVMAEQAAGRAVTSIKAKRALVKEAVRDVFEKKTPIHVVRQRLKDVTEDYGVNWTRVVRTEVALANGAATQQAIADLASPGEDPTVAVVVTKDDRLSPECEAWSLNDDGSYKYFRLSALKPSGFNLGRKKGEWQPSVPPRHFGCRCHVVYVPSGFRLDQYGSLIPLKEGEAFKVE